MMRSINLIGFLVGLIFSQANAWASSPIAQEFAIRRLLNQTYCANPQVFLLPDDVLNKTLDEEIKNILAIEDSPHLVSLAARKELRFHTRIRLHLLVEIAAVLKRHSDVMHLAKIRENSCDSLTHSADFDEVQYQLANCRYLSSINQSPGLAVHLAQKARENLRTASQQYPEVVPPGLDESSKVVLYKSFHIEDLRPGSRDYPEKVAAAMADESDFLLEDRIGFIRIDPFAIRPSGWTIVNLEKLNMSRGAPLLRPSRSVWELSSRVPIYFSSPLSSFSPCPAMILSPLC